jgi:SAM-dependent methyltransferase
MGESLDAKARASAYDDCVVCGSRERRSVRTARDVFRPGYARSFELTECLACGHVMQNPHPGAAELSAAYAVEYAPYKPAWSETRWSLWRALRVLTVRRRMAKLQKWSRGTTLLEVGCGAGDFLLAAHRAGWSVHAVEYNRTMVEALRDRFDLDVKTGELAPGLWEEAGFDVVAFWNVLEHVNDPIRNLGLAARYLRPGGVVLMNIPTRDVPESGRWFGEYWALLDQPRHLNFFGRETLARACLGAGLRLEVFQTGLLEYAWSYYASSWRYAGRSGGGARRAVLFAALAALSPFLLPSMWFRSLAGRGTEAFAAAIKTGAPPSGDGVRVRSDRAR